MAVNGIGAPAKYDWDAWLDGRPWAIPATTLDVDVNTFRAAARQAALRRGFKRVSVVQLHGEYEGYVGIHAIER